MVEGVEEGGGEEVLEGWREQLAAQGRQMVVVTPTLKAAHAASVEVGATAGSAAWLAHQHGWRWDDTGTWTRTLSAPTPEAVLRRGDLLLVDEAGMLDQDTALALLTVADQAGARVALMGDRRQLPAVGRGGLLELAHRWVDLAASVTLDEVHRFTRDSVSADGERVRVPDLVYALMCLQMRDGEDPGGVFDYLHTRGLVQLHASDCDRQAAIAEHVLAAHRAGRSPALVADTREQVADLNRTIRERLVQAGLVDDHHTAGARGGQPVGAGDCVATRRNDRHLDVANRDVWSVTRVRDDGSLFVSSTERGERELPAEYVREHVELAYASTAHGAQGSTATAAHLALGEHTTAASAYVAMTRGRETNTVHLVADDLDEAREQWVAAFARDRADLGPAHAAQRAAREAAGYTPARPLDQVLHDLHVAWREQADRRRELQRITALRDRITEVIALRERREQALAPLEAREAQARAVADSARVEADSNAAAIDRYAQQVRDRLVQAWNGQREQARHAGQVVLAGPGRLGHRLIAVNRATEILARWSTDWQPYLPDMPTSTTAIARYATWWHDEHRITDAFDHAARSQAEHAHPEHRTAQRAAEHAEQQWRHTRRESFNLRSHYDTQLYSHGRLAHADNLDQRLDQADQQISDRQTRLDRVNHRLNRLSREPAVTAQPEGWLQAQHENWRTEDAAERAVLRRIAELRNALAIDAAAHERLQHSHAYEHHHSMQHHMGREGPSLGR